MLEVIKAAAFSQRINRSIDLLVCSASFEDRSKSVARNVTPALIKQSLVCEYQDHPELVKANGDFLRERFGSGAKTVALYSADPLKSADNLLASLKEVQKPEPQHYLVDITTLTRECLLILLSLLRLKLKPTDTVSLAYNLAKDYSLGDPPERKWLARGISEIRSVLAYPGEWRPSRKIHLIILVGIEYERAIKLINAFEPTKVTLGFCDDAETVNLRKLGLNDVFYRRLRNSHLNVNGTFEFHCLDPIQTKDMILEQIGTKPNYNVAVAPLNNKVSTVGAGLAAFECSDIQLCYAQANQYNFDMYSEPSDRFCLFEIPGFPTRL